MECNTKQTECGLNDKYITASPNNSFNLSINVLYSVLCVLYELPIFMEESNDKPILIIQEICMFSIT